MVARGGGFAEPLEMRLNNNRSPGGATRERVAPPGLHHDGMTAEVQGFHPWLPSVAAPRLRKL